jgi:hypothetical protein
MIDLGRWVLLRLRPTAGATEMDWISVSESGAPATWPALRTLLWHAPGDAADVGAGP